VAIGCQAGSTNQYQNAVAIGFQAGSTNQGTSSIAIGNYAGHTNQPANSIVINALSTPYTMSPANASSLYIAPVRSDAAAVNLSVLMYNPTTSEVIRGSTTTSAGNKTFVIDHPVNPDKYLVHACLEGPEAGVYYRGKGAITNNVSTTVPLPPYASFIARDFTVQLSPIYDPNREYPNIQSSDIENNSFVVYGENCKFFWVVQGTRNEIETEPLKTDVEVKGDGPYKYIHLS
jgi:hypothetical protein